MLNISCISFCNPLKFYELSFNIRVNYDTNAAGMPGYMLVKGSGTSCRRCARCPARWHPWGYRACRSYHAHLAHLPGRCSSSDIGDKPEKTAASKLIIKRLNSFWSSNVRVTSELLWFPWNCSNRKWETRQHKHSWEASNEHNLDFLKNILQYLVDTKNPIFGGYQ